MGIKKYFFLPFNLALSLTPAWSKSLDEAVNTITDSEITDPNGFKLMIACWMLLSVLAGSLIVATIIYYLKGKKKK